MYSQPMVVAASGSISLGEATRAFINAAKEKAKDGLTISEFGELFVALMELAMEFVNQFSVPGARKKELVLEALGQLFDALADKLVPIWLYPAWFFAKPAVRTIVLAIADGAIEAILARWKKEQA